MDQKKNSSLTENVYRHQPIMCPWITSQPYPSTHLNKNRINGSNNCSLNNHQWTNIPVSLEASKYHDKSCPSMQQSSSQFFYFLRLMQLFPDTHPATLHTVLTLCKNDFFCAVDKLLYAKRCKTLYNKRFPKCSNVNRNCTLNSPKINLQCGKEDKKEKAQLIKTEEKQKALEDNIISINCDDNLPEDTYENIKITLQKEELEPDIELSSCKLSVQVVTENVEDLSQSSHLLKENN